MSEYECATQGCHRKPGPCGHCAAHCTGEEFKHTKEDEAGE